jgi:hypothetical protein
MGKMIDCRVNGRVPDHLSSGEVTVQVRTRNGVREITDAAAVTIASWWQSAGTEGRAFAALSTTGRVELAALVDGIAAVRRYADTTIDQWCLDMLSTWALRHPSMPGSCETIGCKGHASTEMAYSMPPSDPEVTYDRVCDRCLAGYRQRSIIRIVREIRLAAR